MDLLWMLLLLVLLPSQAQKVEEVRAELGQDLEVRAELGQDLEVRAELGQDVTLTCSIRHGDIYWLMEIHNQFRIEIGKTFSSTYSSLDPPDFKTKFSMAGNRLEIKNISAEDIRRYFCGRKEDSRTVDVDTFRLIADDPPSTPPSLTSTTSTTLSSTSRTPADWLTEPAVVGSLALNAVLMVSLLGLIGACMKRNSSAEFSLDNQEMQNPQILQLSPSGVLSECIYSFKAQHPGSMLPQY